MTGRRSSHYGTRYRLTFRGWLYQHRHDDSQLGDAARLLMADGCLRSANGHLIGYLRHAITAHQATVEQLGAIRQAWDAYQREVPST